jgi:hypothetical protein
LLEIDPKKFKGLEQTMKLIFPNYDEESSERITPENFLRRAN